MQVAGFDWKSVRVSDLCATIEGPDGYINLHSGDPDFALRLAEALVAAHGRRTEERAGMSAIVVK